MLWATFLKDHPKASLVVQWLKDSMVPMQGSWVQSLVRELYPICCN